MAGILKTTKLPKPNINWKERQALAELKKEKSIIILPADKGKATVVMDTDEYEQKVTTSDDKSYEKLKKERRKEECVQCKNTKKLVSIIRKLKEDDKITEEQYKYLYPTAENVPRMYCTPKNQ